MPQNDLDRIQSTEPVTEHIVDVGNRIHALLENDEDVSILETLSAPITSEGETPPEVDAEIDYVPSGNYLIDRTYGGSINGTDNLPVQMYDSYDTLPDDIRDSVINLSEAINACPTVQLRNEAREGLEDMLANVNVCIGPSSRPDRNASDLINYINYLHSLVTQRDPQEVVSRRATNDKQTKANKPDKRSKLFAPIGIEFSYHAPVRKKKKKLDDLDQLSDMIDDLSFSIDTSNEFATLSGGTSSSSSSITVPNGDGSLRITGDNLNVTVADSETGQSATATVPPDNDQNPPIVDRSGRNARSGIPSRPPSTGSSIGSIEQAQADAALNGLRLQISDPEPGDPENPQQLPGFELVPDNTTPEPEDDVRQLPGGGYTVNGVEPDTDSDSDNNPDLHGTSRQRVLARLDLLRERRDRLERERAMAPGNTEPDSDSDTERNSLRVAIRDAQNVVARETYRTMAAEAGHVVTEDEERHIDGILEEENRQEDNEIAADRDSNAEIDRAISSLEGVEDDYSQYTMEGLRALSDGDEELEEDEEYTAEDEVCDIADDENVPQDGPIACDCGDDEVCHNCENDIIPMNQAIGRSRRSGTLYSRQMRFNSEGIAERESWSEMEQRTRMSQEGRLERSQDDSTAYNNRSRGDDRNTQFYTKKLKYMLEQAGLLDGYGSRVYKDGDTVVEVCTPIMKNWKSLKDWFALCDGIARKHGYLPWKRTAGGGGMHLNMSFNKDVPNWKLAYTNFFILIANHPELNWIFNEPSDDHTANAIVMDHRFISAYHNLNMNGMNLTNQIWRDISVCGGKGRSISGKDDHHFEIRTFEMVRSPKEFTDIIELYNAMLGFCMEIAEWGVTLPLEVEVPVGHVAEEAEERGYVMPQEKEAVLVFGELMWNAESSFNKLVRDMGLDPKRYRKYIQRNLHTRRGHPYGKKYFR